MIDRRSLRGALVALVLLGGVLLAWQRPNPFADTTTVRAVVDDVSQVGVVGAEVQVAGTPVGRIAGSERRGDDAVLELELDAEAPTVHEDARVVLRPRLAFEGTAYADLDPGSPSAPALGDREIPRAQTAAAVSMDRVLRLADRPTREALQEVTAGLAGALEREPADALDRTLATAPGLLRDVARSARAVRGPAASQRERSALRGAVDGFSRTAAALAGAQADLAPALRGASRTARALDAGAGAPLRASLRELAPTARALQSGGAALDRTLAAARPLAEDLRPAARALPAALRDARPLLREAAPVLREARPVVRDADRALVAARGAAAPTRGLLRDVDPTLETLDETLLPALAKDTPVLEVPAFRAFLNLFAGGGGASRPFVRPGEPGASAGTGHVMRFGIRFLTGIGIPLPPCGPIRKLAPGLGDQLAKAGSCTP
ncbi:MlaD family protein [Conexibacter sp. SYSU D00693]|uniref:MlaD family protein n=1 Tax=Conexibacter sp. SYSU D00693 TaxID=2812560 RepID=UPI00196AAA46|nr:MlaD family protein [Conexibacter sp. SYSU D00693]